VEELTEDQRETLVDHLVGNCDCETEPMFGENDFDTLEKMDDVMLVNLAGEEFSETLGVNMEYKDKKGMKGKKKLKGMKSKKKETEKDEEGDLKEYSTSHLKKELDKRTKKVTANQETELDNEEWLASAPEEIRSVVVNAIQRENAQRDQMVAKITDNDKNIFTEDQLQKMTINQLTGITSLCEESEKVQESQDLSRTFPNYQGRSGVRVTGNKKETALVSEDLDYSTINTND